MKPTRAPIERLATVGGRPPTHRTSIDNGAQTNDDAPTGSGLPHTGPAKASSARRTIAAATESVVERNGAPIETGLPTDPAPWEGDLSEWRSNPSTSSFDLLEPTRYRLVHSEQLHYRLIRQVFQGAVVIALSCGVTLLFLLR
jgi:hypothetical protein